MFDRNDYNDLFKEYFEALVLKGVISADPSGWARPESEVKLRVRMPNSGTPLSHYLIDNRMLIAQDKEQILDLLSAWDGRAFAFDEATIMPSISAASLTVLLLLREEGVESILFETPAYYATIDQAKSV